MKQTKTPLGILGEHTDPDTAREILNELALNGYAIVNMRETTKRYRAKGDHMSYPSLKALYKHFDQFMPVEITYLGGYTEITDEMRRIIEQEEGL